MENSNPTQKETELDDKFRKLINDANLHVKEAETQIREWHIKHEERLRHLATIEIIYGK